VGHVALCLPHRRRVHHVADGGRGVGQGQAAAISWVADEGGDDALVELSWDGGRSWTNVAIGGAGLIPLVDGRAPLYTPMVPSVQGVARITPQDPLFTNRFDTSMSGPGDYFTIAGLCRDRPQAGEKYSIGTTNLIRFKAAGTKDDDKLAQIYYSGDGVTFDTTPPHHQSAL